MSKPRACRSTIKPATPVVTDPAALERRKTISRLRRAKQGLEAFAFRLESLHADITGGARDYYGGSQPILPDEARAKMQGIARTKKEASEGCALCAAWLEETADLRQKIDDLRNAPLPRKDPSYTGRPLPPSAVNAMGRVRYKTPEARARAEAAAMERRERSAALVRDYMADILAVEERRAVNKVLDQARERAEAEAKRAAAIRMAYQREAG